MRTWDQIISKTNEATALDIKGIFFDQLSISSSSSSLLLEASSLS